MKGRPQDCSDPCRQCNDPCQQCGISRPYIDVMRVVTPPRLKVTVISRGDMSSTVLVPWYM